MKKSALPRFKNICFTMEFIILETKIKYTHYTNAI